MNRMTVASPARSEMEKMEEFLAREYLPVIRQFPEEEVQESLLHESVITVVCVKDGSKKPPSAQLSNCLPKELAFLEGPSTDLGFGHLSLPKTEVDKILRAFCGEGVAVPGTPYKLRHSVMSLFTFVEPATGHETVLPADWRQFVRSHYCIQPSLRSSSCCHRHIA